MAPFHNNLTRRDGLLILIGASVVYIVTSLFHYGPAFQTFEVVHDPSTRYSEHLVNQTILSSSPITAPIHATPAIDLGVSAILETTVIAHAPGWTLFRNLYMSNGTLFVVSSDPSSFPEIRMMTSTGLAAFNTPENIYLREPTDQDLQIIAPAIANSKWGGDPAKHERHRIWSVEGASLLVNEPSQFLNHYYHFVAELVLGAWAFFYGAFNPTARLVDPAQIFGRLDTSLPSFNLPTTKYQPPALNRIIFLHAQADEWKDKPGFNSYFFHAVFPSLDMESEEDWIDRSVATFSNAASKTANLPEKAWHFPLALLSDRSAAFRGEACGARTQRIAAEAWEYMIQKKGIDVVGHWWSDIRHRLYRFAGVEKPSDSFNDEPPMHDDMTDPQLLLPQPPEEIVITYINRQGVRRHLIPSNHDSLIVAIEELVKRKRREGKNWVFRDVKPEKLSKDQQVKLASETTIMLGVHGNGLSHLVLMEPNRYSAVIEMFYPGGFAHDYEWTSRALGMRHFSVWNDTYFTHPNEPEIGYPEGFQGTSIPVHGPTVAQLIEERLEGRLEY